MPRLPLFFFIFAATMGVIAALGQRWWTAVSMLAMALTQVLIMWEKRRTVPPWRKPEP